MAGYLAVAVPIYRYSGHLYARQKVGSLVNVFRL